MGAESDLAGLGQSWVWERSGWGEWVNTGFFGINLMCVGKGQWEIGADESTWFERFSFNGLERP